MSNLNKISTVDDDLLLANCSNEALLDMQEAAQEVLFWQSVLLKTNDGVVSEFLRDVEEVYHDQFYPADTVEDKETGCQYYFHAHSDRPEEYGHFHTYVMEAGIPDNLHAIKPASMGSPNDQYRTHCHLVAIGIENDGTPTSMFTLNHWSAHEAKYSLESLEQILDCFDISHAVPSYPVNRWISALLRLYRPKIIDLFVQREDALEGLARQQPDVPPEANQAMDVTSKIDIAIEAFALEVQQEVARRAL